MRVPLALMVAALSLAPVVSVAGQVDPKTALLERDGFRLLNAGETRRAADAFKEALKTDPRNPRLHLGAGVAAYLEHDDAAAKASLERALELAPSLTEAREFLGRLLRRQGDLAGAIRVYEELAGAAGSHAAEAAETLERWKRERELHDRMRQTIGARFTVSFEGPEEEALAASAIESLDRAYWRIGDLLGAAYPLDPISVVLYTREQFRDITRSPMWAAGAFDGIIRVPVRGALSKPGELDRVLAHEFAHALVRILGKQNVPTWLNEGLASAVESDDLAWATDAIERVGQSVPLSVLAKGFGRFNDAEAALAYATSAVTVRRMLDEAGGYAVANLLRDLGDGADLERAFERRIQRPLSDFSK